MSKQHAIGVASAHAAAVLALSYAAVSLYWAVGGTALLSTVGGTVADIARHGGLPAVALGLATAAVKLACAVLALALVRPWGPALPRPLLLSCAAAASVMLSCYGAIQVAAGSLVLSDTVRAAAPVNWTALRWHVWIWDGWFLIWGIEGHPRTLLQHPVPGPAESGGCARGVPGGS